MSIGRKGPGRCVVLVDDSLRVPDTANERRVKDSCDRPEEERSPQESSSFQDLDRSLNVRPSTLLSGTVEERFDGLTGKSRFEPQAGYCREANTSSGSRSRHSERRERCWC
jgi:hypothetical protein